jgi:hypothetical protein
MSDLCPGIVAAFDTLARTNAVTLLAILPGMLTGRLFGGLLG